MWLHYCLFAGIGVLGVVYKADSRFNRWLYYTAVFGVIFIFATFRAYTVGNDTQEYLRIFNMVRSCDSLLEASAATRYEIGYLALNYMVGKLTSDFTVLLAIITTFYMSSVLRFISKHASDPKAAVLLCFSLSMFYDVMITMRQCIAVGIFLFAIEYLIERKPVKYVVLILISALFQNVAIIFIFLYLAPKADLKKTVDFLKWCLVIIAALTAVNYLSIITGYIFPYFSHYFLTIYAEGGVRIASVLFLLVRLLIVGFLWTVRAFTFSNDYGGERKVFEQLMIIDCIVAAMSISFNILDRVENFFCIGFVVAVVNAMRPLSVKNRLAGKWIMITIAFIYLTSCLILRSNWYGLFPYQFQLNGG